MQRFILRSARSRHYRYACATSAVARLGGLAVCKNCLQRSEAATIVTVFWRLFTAPGVIYPLALVRLSSPLYLTSSAATPDKLDPITHHVVGHPTPCPQGHQHSSNPVCQQPQVTSREKSRETRRIASSLQVSCVNALNGLANRFLIPRCSL